MSANSWLLQKIASKGSEAAVLFGGSDCEIDEYLHEVNSYHVDQMVNELSRLANEKESLEEDTESMTFANYKTFIQVADTSKKILSDFVHVHDNVDHLLSALPGLDRSTRQFCGEAAKINSERTKNTLALRRHTQMLEILEIPQVMETCVRAGYFEEALQLINHAAKLERRLGHIELVQAIVIDMNQQKSLFLETLLEHLSTTLTLSSCLKVVSYLRGLDYYSEPQLRIKFLSLRADWLDNSLACIPMTTVFDHMCKTIELWRVNMPDLISQYKASFPDDDLPVVARQPIECDDSLLVCNGNAIFSSWIVERVNALLISLQTNMIRSNGFVSSSIDSNSSDRLQSILSQCMQLGLSLSRSGLDMRHVIAPIVMQFMHNSIRRSIEHATQQYLQGFEAEVESSSFVRTAFEKSSALPSDQTLQAPFTLLQSSSLAQFCNDVLRTVNNFRCCFTVQSAFETSRILDGVLQKVAQQFDVVYNASQEKVQKSLENFWQVFTSDFVGFLNLCLTTSVPLSEVIDCVGGVHVDSQSLSQFIPQIDASMLEKSFR